MSKLFFVTGSSGFIGSHICNNLLSQGFNVIGLDVVAESTEYKTVKCSILDYNSIDDIFRKHRPDAVVHCAGPTANSFSKSFEEAISLQINGTINIVKASKRYAVGNFIFLSSDHVYMCNDFKQDIDEDTSLHLSFDKPENFGRNLFAITKASSEAICVREIPNSVIFRLASIYGPGKCTNLIKGMIDDAKDKGQIEIWGDGNRSIQFTHVSDVSTVISRSTSLNAGIYNLSNDKKVKVIDAAKIISKYFNAEITNLLDREGGPMFPYASTNKLLTQLKNFNYIPLTEGIKLMTGDNND